MALATDADLVLLVPGAAAVSAELRARALTEAAAWIDDLQYGARAPRAHWNLAAHFLTFVPGGLAGGESAGPVTARAAGAISVSYGSASTRPGDPNDFTTTSYGRAFAAIRDTLVSYPEAG